MIKTMTLMCLTSLKLSRPFGGLLRCKGMEFRHTLQVVHLNFPKIIARIENL